MSKGLLQPKSWFWFLCSHLMEAAKLLFFKNGSQPCSFQTRDPHGLPYLSQLLLGPMTKALHITALTSVLSPISMYTLHPRHPMSWPGLLFACSTCMFSHLCLTSTRHPWDMEPVMPFPDPLNMVASSWHLSVTVNSPSPSHILPALLVSVKAWQIPTRWVFPGQWRSCCKSWFATCLARGQLSEASPSAPHGWGSAGLWPE